MWTWELIEREWLGGTRIAVSDSAIVEAFNRVESMLGPGWILRCRGLSGSDSGAAPTLCVVTMGQLLAILDGVANTDGLITKLTAGDHSAAAELTGLFLLKSGRSDISSELEPEVLVSGRSRKPDFRISLPGTDWVYVEVTQTSMSREREAANLVLEELSTQLNNIKESFALEIFLRRFPSTDEITQIKVRLPTFCVSKGINREDLGELGFLLVNLDPPGMVNLRDYGEPYRPKICVMKAICGPDEPHRHICVRLAFPDERAQRFLESEAKQLPSDAATLIMVQMSNAPGGHKTWEPIIRQRFQRFHTRVSAVCLFDSGLEPTPGGEAWIPRTRLIRNPNALYHLPVWLEQQISMFAQYRNGPE
jgi:hypothetical protein